MRLEHENPHHPRRLGALLAISALLGLGFEVALAHAGFRHGAQLLPLYAASVAVLFSSAALVQREQRVFSVLVGMAGGLCVLVGVLGLALHSAPVIADLWEQPLSLGALRSALEGGPPPLAPGGFAAVGALLLVLATDRIRISFRRGPRNTWKTAP